MYVKKTLIKLVVAAALLFPVALSAQTSSINAFSPYTMYGIGELNMPGTAMTRSMGGAGVALRSANSLNLMNPASLSVAPQKSFMFDFGVEGQNFYNRQTLNAEKKKTAYNTFNFRDVAFRMPLAKKIGLGFSLTPYSSVGYRIQYTHAYDPTDPVWGNMGLVQYNYSGEGDVTEVKVGLGWEIFKHFSVGIAAQYYWGDITRQYTAAAQPYLPNGNSTVSSIIGTDNYSVSRIKGQIGMQWMALVNEKRALTFGAAFDFGGNLEPRRSNSVVVNNMQNANVRTDSMDLKLVLPRQLQLGMVYQTEAWTLCGDYVYQNWGGRNSGTVMTGVSGSKGDMSSYRVAYTNTHTLKFGAEWIPSRYDARHFMKRWAYRAGLRCGMHNQTFNGQKLMECTVTAGIGIPASRRFLAISAVDLGVELGWRGFNAAEHLGLVRQQFFKFSIGVTLFAGDGSGDYWFLRPKYD